MKTSLHQVMAVRFPAIGRLLNCLESLSSMTHFKMRLFFLVLLGSITISNVQGQTWYWQGAGTAGNTATDPTDPTTQWGVASNWDRGTLPEGKYMDSAYIHTTNAGNVYAATGNFFSTQVGGLSPEAALYVTDGVDFASSMLLVGLGTFTRDEGKFGKVIQTGGAVNIGENPLILGFYPDGQGTYELRDGSLTTVGSMICGREGSGTFIQTGGLCTAQGIGLSSYLGSSGTYELKGGKLVAESIGIGMVENATDFVFTGGILDVKQMVYAGLTNNGGTLAVRRITYIGGDYIQTSGALEITLGEGFNDTLDVLGRANITGGKLDIVLDNGYTPKIGDTFTIMTEGSNPLNLDFDSITNGYRIYTEGNNVVLQSIPEPATLNLLLLGGLAAVRRRKGNYGKA